LGVSVYIEGSDAVACYNSCTYWYKQTAEETATVGTASSDMVGDTMTIAEDFEGVLTAGWNPILGWLTGSANAAWDSIKFW
jgi:hypothetical protein